MSRSPSNNRKSISRSKSHGSKVEKKEQTQPDRSHSGSSMKPPPIVTTNSSSNHPPPQHMTVEPSSGPGTGKHPHPHPHPHPHGRGREHIKQQSVCAGNEFEVTPFTPQQHTHNITINNNEKEYKELKHRMDSIETKLDSVNNMMFKMQRQINELSNNIADIKSTLSQTPNAVALLAKSISNSNSNSKERDKEENEYRASMMAMLYDIRKEMQHIKTINTSNRSSNRKRGNDRDRDNHNIVQPPIKLTRNRSKSPMHGQNNYEYSHSSSDNRNGRKTSNEHSKKDNDNHQYQPIHHRHGHNVNGYRHNSRRGKYDKSHSSHRRVRGLQYSNSPHRENTHYRSSDNSASPNANVLRGHGHGYGSDLPEIVHKQPHPHLKIGLERIRAKSARIDGDKSTPEPVEPPSHHNNYRDKRRGKGRNYNGDGDGDVDGNDEDRYPNNNNGSDEDIKIIKPSEHVRVYGHGDGHHQSRSKSMKRMKNKSRDMRQDMNFQGERMTQKETFRRWLTNHVKLPQYYEVFVENGVEDFHMVMDMTINELRMIGVHTKKHQLQIQKEITKLRNQMKRRNSANLFDTV